MRRLELLECDCGHEEERWEPFEVCECGKTKCRECSQTCEWCGHEACEKCMVDTSDGWACDEDCESELADLWARQMDKIDDVIARVTCKKSDATK